MSKSKIKTRRLVQYIALLGLSDFLLLMVGGVVISLNQPTGLEHPQAIHIQTGMSARSIGELLENRGLIRNARFFEWTVRWQGLAHKLEAGTYRLDGTKSTLGVAMELLKAPVKVQRITLPEGLTRETIAGLLQLHTSLDSSRFTELTEDAAFIHQLGIKAPTLEGYLFPETYFFDEKTTEKDAIERMVGEFHKVFADSLYLRLNALHLTLHQVVTLASIVEREAVVSEERPVISQVFQKRLKLNRMLESCATVEYALGVHKKRLTRDDLKVKSPFNTYLHRGLPPGPIGNPGKSSIQATLYPADTDYLYFVARGDGRHVFSHTHAEHERAKRAIRLAMRNARQRVN